MIDLRDIAKMVPVSMDKPLILGATGSRNIRLEVNTGEPAQFWVSKYGDNDPKTHEFLGVIMGRESVLFPAHGPVAVFADCDGPCFAWAAEIEQTWVEVVEASFTRPHKRNKMSAELTQVAEMLQNAMGVRMASMEREVYERVAREMAARPQPKGEKNGSEHSTATVADTEGAEGPDEPDTVAHEGDGSGGGAGTGVTRKGGKKPDEKPASE